MMKALVTLCIICLSGYAASTLFVLSDEKGELVSLSPTPFFPPQDPLAIAFQAVITKESSSHKVSVENPPSIGCSKGVFSGKDPRCVSPFFSVSEAVFVLPKKADIGEVIGAAIANAIVVPLEAVTLTAFVQKKFDPLSYNEFLDKYGLERQKKRLFEEIPPVKGVTYRGCDLAQFEAGDELRLNPQSGCQRKANEGLFLYHSSKGFFSDQQGEALGLFSPKDLEEPLSIVQGITQRSAETFMDVSSLFPVVPLPEPLPELFIEKSQFEKEVAFQKRKREALEKREEEQKRINQTYIEAVKTRNMKIFEMIEERKGKLERFVTTVRKSAFLAVGHPPIFSFESYDAEKEILYGKVGFGAKTYRVASLSVPPESAKKIYDTPKEVRPLISYTGGEGIEGASFTVKKLELQTPSGTFPLSYTDNRYTPPMMRLVIPSYDLAAFRKEIADASMNPSQVDALALQALQDMEKYRVANNLLVDDKTIQRVNAKTPSWYDDPACGEMMCAVGRAETQQEALKVTLAQLGCMVNAHIDSTLEVEKMTKNGVLKEENRYLIKQTCRNTFEEDEVKITHSTEIDGWYYVRVIVEKHGKL